MKPEDFTEEVVPLSAELKRCKAIAIPGLKLEFGVAMGSSLKRLALMWPDETVWGFDSFKGIPERWQKGKELKPEGYMSTHGKMPRNLPDNAQCVVGFFKQSLPPWWEEHRGDISFLHIDCDLYSATRTVLNTIDDGIVAGTIIRFDDLIAWRKGYDNWEDGEWKALHEWLERGAIVEPLWRNRKEAGTIRVLSRA